MSFFFFFFFFDFVMKVLDDLVERQRAANYGLKDFDFQTENLSLASSHSLNLFEIFEIILIRF
jgi:hypothetical protein